MGKAVGIGLMSGTSLDGVDAALVEIEKKNGNIEVNLIESLAIQYDDVIRRELMEVCSPLSATVQKISSMNMFLGKEFGNAVNKLLVKSNRSKEDIHFISSHGQTIYHQPLQGETEVDIPGTLQIGDISVLSETTGIAVVGDFRTADMAANGQGAPLVSYVDYLLFHSTDKSIAVQNIGGIGNVTYLAKNGHSNDVQSFDTGPGNMVIDEVVFRITNGKSTYDKNGQIAYKGKINQALLDQLVNHNYFSMNPPKTTGRELFGKSFVTAIFNDFGDIDSADLVTTVTEWTALTIANSYNDFLTGKGNAIDEVIVGGGGSYNPYLMERLAYHLPDMNVYTHEKYNISSDFKEAIAFAILGYQCICGEYNQIPSATGADKPVIMGKTAYTHPDAFKRLESLRSVLT
ncbi:anhydro-N-acetylmuramic acid kinase [Oceanobacillus longus]|uniref:Anhydro-N-acetylmuramic acid kinase n=1 Tax=Oceanobacillus longus TaxID=930120 RepID=A0ABV8GYV8_9BACI